MSIPFTHLHVHSHYSILDGMSKIPDLVNKAYQTGMRAIALTDHGNMFGIMEFLEVVDKKNGSIKKEIKRIERELKSAEITPDQKAEWEIELAQNRAKLFKPIVGVEAYCARRTLYDKDGNLKVINQESGREQILDRSGNHLILLAKNKKGYQNLCKLVSISWVEGNYYTPRIDKKLLEQYKEGLIVCSACLGGEIPQKIMAGDLEGAEAAIRWYKELFGNDYYLEIQRHQATKPNADRNVYERQKEVNAHILELAKKTDTKVIATNDVHFVEEEHAEGHDRLICLSTGKDLDDPDRMHYTMQEWLKSPEEMFQVFADLPEALSNTQEIVDKVEYYSIESGPLMPKFDIPSEFGTEEAYRQKYSKQDLFNEFTCDENGNVVLSEAEANEKIESLGGYDKLYRIKLEADYLAKLAWIGAEKRYAEITPEIRERIIFELHIMKTMGYPGYFLIVQDFIQAARDMGVSVGPGRGSAAGSVVAYCLRITDVDPLKYDLLFERFLNPDRISLPDIDIDFDDDGRGSVLRWVNEKYGKEKVAHIVTYGTMATKSSIADVGRVQRVPLSEVNRIKALVPDKFDDSFADPVTGKTPKVSVKTCVKLVPELKMARNGHDSNIADMLKYAEMLEGTVRQTGVHACGVIIGSDDLTNFVPLSTAKEKSGGEDLLVTQYEGSVVENVGLIKMDFLGLKTLSIIKEVLSNIRKSKGIEIDIDAIPIDDKATYELYSKGLTTGTFQFESAGMQKYLKELQPTTFEDLIAMNALYRPGPMQYIPQFINRKHGREEVAYDIPIMEKYLKETYGITVYQEQVMLLSRLLADFTRGESDNLRKAMGKKMKDKLDKMKPDFIERGKKNGHDANVLDKIWTDWEAFASYAFNKSHATCYSWISYQTAYLKAHYPSEFMAANLTRNKDDIAEVGKFMDECRNLGINVLIPDVNESDLNFSVNAKGDIRFGLGGIKGVGEGAVEAIVKEREKGGKYTSIYDFVERVNLLACNKKAVESLALAGAFDCFPNLHREQLFTNNSKGELVIESIVRYGNKYQNDVSMVANSLFGGEFGGVDIVKPELPETPYWSTLERLNKERTLVGMYLSAHPLDQYRFEIENFSNVTTTDLKELPALNGKSVKLGGMVTDFRHGTSQKGNPYGILTIEDYEGSFEIALFGKKYIEFQQYMIKDLYVMVSGVVAVQSFGNYAPKEPQNGVVDTSKIKFELQRIDQLNEVKKRYFRTVALQIPLTNLTDELVTELLFVCKENRGEGQMYIEVYDPLSKININMRSRVYSIDMTPAFYNFLKQGKQQELFSYVINKHV